MDKDGNEERMERPLRSDRGLRKKAEKPITPGSARLDENGHEVVSSIPMEPPLGYKKQPTMIEHVRNMVRSEMLRKEAEAAGMESFEDADDLNIPDDPIDPSTPYEEVFEPPIPPDAPGAPPPQSKAPETPTAVPSSTEPVITPPVPAAAPPKP